MIKNHFPCLSASSSKSCLSLSESETYEDDFHPEQFGLVDNPGVVRFGCLDYPLAVTEYSDQEYVTEHNTDNTWKRVSCDDLTQDADITEDIYRDCKIFSRSLDDVSKLGLQC